MSTIFEVVAVLFITFMVVMTIKFWRMVGALERLARSAAQARWTLDAIHDILKRRRDDELAAKKARP